MTIFNIMHMSAENMHAFHKISITCGLIAATCWMVAVFYPDWFVRKYLTISAHTVSIESSLISADVKIRWLIPIAINSVYSSFKDKDLPWFDSDLAGAIQEIDFVSLPVVEVAELICASSSILLGVLNRLCQDFTLVYWISFALLMAGCFCSMCYAGGCALYIMSHSKLDQEEPNNPLLARFLFEYSSRRDKTGRLLILVGSILSTILLIATVVVFNVEDTNKFTDISSMGGGNGRVVISTGFFIGVTGSSFGVVSCCFGYLANSQSMISERHEAERIKEENIHKEIDQYGKPLSEKDKQKMKKQEEKDRVARRKMEKDAENAAYLEAAAIQFQQEIDTKRANQSQAAKEEASLAHFHNEQLHAKNKGSSSYLD